jgi:protocatechuate 3,4-dioxygenase beta subunit
VLTNSNGLFSASWSGPSSNTLRVFAKGYLMSESPAGMQVRAGALENRVIVLEESDREVSGLVVDASGGPVAEACVTVRDPTSNALIARTAADDMGNFSFGAPVGAVTVSAEAEAYSRAVRSLEPPAVTLILALAPASSIVGSVVAAEPGEPLGEGWVTAEGINGLRERATVRAEADGSFRFDALPAGAYLVSAIADTWRSEEAWINLAIGQASEPLVLLAVRSLTLTGAVSVAGQPCRGGEVSVRGPVSLARPTDGAGGVRIQGLASGRYAVRVSCEPALPVEDTLELETSLQKGWDLSLGLAVRGRVESASGQPVPGARVGVQPFVDPEAQAAVVEAPAHWLVECMSDAQGEFVCPGLMEGNHQCSLLDRRGELAHVNVTAASSPHVVLRAKASGSILAVLPSADGHRSPELIAFAENSSKRVVRGRETRDGFAFERLPLDEYRLFLGPVGGQAESQTVVLESDGQVARVVLPAPALTQLAGQVMDERGEPVPDAWVRVSVAESVSEQARSVGAPVLTDQQGMFSIDGLAPGRYDLKATSSLGEAALLDVQGGDSNVLLRLPTYASAAGSVEDETGAVVAAFELEYARQDSPVDKISGNNGRWTLPWLAPGRYAVTAKTPTGIAVQTLTLAPGEHRTLALTLDEAPKP